MGLIRRLVTRVAIRIRHVRLNPVFSIYLPAFRSFSLHLSYSCYNSFLFALPTSLATATGFLTENFNDRPTFPRPIYGISCGNVKHRGKCTSGTSDRRCKDKQQCNGTVRWLSEYPRRNSLRKVAICGKSSDTDRSFHGFHRLFLSLALIFRNNQIYFVLSHKCMQVTRIHTLVHMRNHYRIRVKFEGILCYLNVISDNVHNKIV